MGAFETVHDDWVRLALAGGPDEDALVVVAASYDRHGVVGYAAATGQRLWQRKDLRQCDDVRFAGGDLVAVNIEGRRKHVIDCRTGETVQALARMSAMACYDPDTARVAWWDSGHRLRVDHARAAEPAVVALPPWPQEPPFPTGEVLRGDTLVVNASSASRGHREDRVVWCVDLATSEERWQVRVPGARVDVDGIRSDGCVLGRAEGAGGDGSRLWIANPVGALTELPWDRSESVAHLRAAGLLVTSHRRVLDDTTFEKVATFDRAPVAGAS
ncbi:MAG: hypothetical protein U0Q15_08260 [Kineosporiaceae bacterium]